MSGKRPGEKKQQLTCRMCRRRVLLYRSELAAYIDTREMRVVQCPYCGKGIPVHRARDDAHQP